METKLLGEEKPRKRGAGIVVLVLLGVTAGIILSLVLWIRSVADRRWGELEARVAREIAAHRAREIRRQALWLLRQESFPDQPIATWPEDPYGTGPLKYERSPEGRSCVIWSLGYNGEDDRAAEGTWTNKSWGDIVLRLKRE